MMKKYDKGKKHGKENMHKQCLKFFLSRNNIIIINNTITGNDLFNLIVALSY